ncbi:hypothetical protein RM697_03100 [Ichthyenterobacterium sp. W332]|uniref:Uncharacterized protein n=1 Tax=Microcosmobacter mediterraneus TaxID=3075607 RepID=A0ABU2YHG7_9FLAO|nr:hypothetical protein [Ichthyenterobacterium sp. W332]MDT0557617.1 hypothetical protein [Ichthyenterobacterium sp. W332]
MKTLKLYLPELYLIAAIIIYYISAALIVNWMAFGLLVIVAVLLITKHKVFGICVGLCLVIINLYMVLALLSELSEFETFNNDALQLLVLGSLFLGLNLLFSGMLIYKNLKASITIAKY